MKFAFKWPLIGWIGAMGLFLLSSYSDDVKENIPLPATVADTYNGTMIFAVGEGEASQSTTLKLSVQNDSLFSQRFPRQPLSRQSWMTLNRSKP